MSKTKLGVTVGLFGAGMFFMGLISIWLLLILAGYALLYEQDAVLKKTAVKAVAVILLFAILSVCLSLCGDAASVLTRSINIFWPEFRIPHLGNILSIFGTILGALKAIVLLTLGFFTLNKGEFNVVGIDGLIEKNM